MSRLTASVGLLCVLLVLPARASLQLLDLQSRGGSTTARLGQLHEGVPVLGSTAVVRVDQRGDVTWSRASLAEGLTAGTSPSITADQALAAAMGSTPDAEASSPALAVLPDGHGGALVYAVRVFSEAPLLSLEVLVDAHTGEVARVRDRIVSAWARAYETSPVHGDPIEVELSDLVGDGTVLEGEYAVAQSITSGNSLGSAEHLAVADEAGDFLYDPIEPSVDDPFAEVNAYYHVTRAASYFAESFGHEFDSNIEIYTNFFISQPNDCANAYYAQDMMGNDLLIFGQYEMDFGYDGDVVLHEFGHLINHDRAPLEMEYFYHDDHGMFAGPSAIDEGMADYWSASLQDSSTHAEYSSGALGMGRELDNDRTCPGDVVGESHHDGQVVSGASWEIREALGAEIADELMYEALGLISGRPTFGEFAEAVSAIAREKQGYGELTVEQAATVDDVLEGRGLLDCGRSVPLDDGVTTDLMLDVFYWLYGATWTDECQALQDSETRFGAYFQLSFTTPPALDGELLELAFDLDIEAEDGTLDAGDLDYTVYLRREEMVTFEMVETANPVLFAYSGSGPMPLADQYDLAVDGSPGSIVLTPSGELALEPDTTYHLAVSHMTCETARLSITPTLSLEQAPEGDDDDDEADESGDEQGCQCGQGRATGAGPAGLGLLALLGITAIRRAGPRWGRRSPRS
jgi:MYXO-CTERM domain-containing protein